MYAENFCSNEKYFKIYPAVVKSGEKSVIRVISCDALHKFCDDTVYLVRFVPKDVRNTPDGEAFSIWGFEGVCEVHEVKPRNGIIELTYVFEGQQEWIINIAKKGDGNADWWWTDSLPKSRLRLSIYSLSPEIYGTVALKGDLHIHTNCSDGRESQEMTVAGYRREGYDFVSFTDHRIYNDAKWINDYFSFADTLKVIPGEEVHEKADALIHMVSLGGKYCVSDLFEKEPEYVKQQLEIAEKNYIIPDGVDKTEYLYRIFIYNEIKKSGGYAVFPHPMWQIPARFNTTLNTSIEVLKNGLCDAFELIGGCTPEGNNLQVNLWNEFRANGISVPVVGSSDSHSMIKGETAFKEQYTLCFVRKGGDVIDAISNGLSVAVEAYPGENVRVYGDFELVKYAHFLRRCYFPKHDELCHASGALLWEYVCGDKSLKDVICSVENKIASFQKEFFGIKEF